MLRAMATAAAPGTRESVFAHRHLAELLVEENPWRASISAKQVLAVNPEDEQAWAVLGLAQTLLGHYRFARTAYERALTKSPSNPWYAHNLGHLLDVALDQPEEALPWLRWAFERVPESGEIGASYAHALARAGHLELARRILELHVPGPSPEHARLLEWVDRGAPKTTSHPSRAVGLERQAATGTAPKRTRRGLKAAERALEAGMLHLPFSERGRACAQSILRDALWRIPLTAAPSTQTYVAACAHAANVLEGHSLSTGEVAAPFRAKVGEVRAFHGELVSALGL
jgi:tetratricopeptide (TPR) repeat protein